jgi:hypothetical protein
MMDIYKLCVIIQLKCKIRSASTNDIHARDIIEILRDETMMKKNNFIW